VRGVEEREERAAAGYGGEHGGQGERVLAEVGELRGAAVLLKGGGEDADGCGDELGVKGREGGLDRAGHARRVGFGLERSRRSVSIWVNVDIDVRFSSGDGRRAPERAFDTVEPSGWCCRRGGAHGSEFKGDGVDEDAREELGAVLS
jgi:hypothetical protein